MGQNPQTYPPPLPPLVPKSEVKIKRRTGAAVGMKDNKPICKKMWFEKKKEKRKKYLGQDSNKDHVKANSSLSLLCHATKYLLGKANYYIYQKNSASKCCLKLVELYLSRIEMYTKKL